MKIDANLGGDDYHDTEKVSGPYVVRANERELLLGL
jgi:hypothetical protein